MPLVHVTMPRIVGRIWGEAAFVTRPVQPWRLLAGPHNLERLRLQEHGTTAPKDAGS